MATGNNIWTRGRSLHVTVAHNYFPVMLGAPLGWLVVLSVVCRPPQWLNPDRFPSKTYADIVCTTDVFPVEIDLDVRVYSHIHYGFSQFVFVHAHVHVVLLLDSSVHCMWLWFEVSCISRLPYLDWWHPYHQIFCWNGMLECVAAVSQNVWRNHRQAVVYLVPQALGGISGIALQNFSG